jgi:ATP-binding cassette subfamily F protein uup
MDNVAEGSQHVTVNGRDLHVASYLRDFLFPPERLQSPVSTLSGGERNRLLLARLFARPANLLIMDEPTNDLDVETLELLEELLMEYEGTLLLVSHDRAFLDNVITRSLVFEGDGVIGEFVGGYSDWLAHKKDVKAAVRPTSRAADKSGETPAPAALKKKKLSYKDQSELDELPRSIEILDAEQAQLQEAIGDSGFYQQDNEKTAATLARLEEVGEALEACYSRWEELDAG